MICFREKDVDILLLAMSDGVHDKPGPLSEYDVIFANGNLDRPQGTVSIDHVLLTGDWVKKVRSSRQAYAVGETISESPDIAWGSAECYRINVAKRHTASWLLPWAYSRAGLWMAPPTEPWREKINAQAAWVDDVADVQAQGSPGAVERYSAEEVMVAHGNADAAHMALWQERRNAEQALRRRANYYELTGAGMLEIIPLPGECDQSYGLDDVFHLPEQDKGHILVNGQWVENIRSRELQHEFRLRRLVYAANMGDDPVARLAASMRHAATLSDDYFTSEDWRRAHGNQRQAWALASCFDVEITLGVLGSGCQAVMETYEDIRGTKNDFHYITENYEPGRGHHDATVVSWQMAVQLIAGTGGVGAAIRAGNGAAFRTAQKVQRQAVEGLMDCARMSALGGGEDDAAQAKGSYAYDVLPNAKDVEEYQDRTGTLWWSKDGSPYAGTHDWTTIALGEWAEKDPAFYLRGEVVNVVKNYWMKANHLKASDKNADIAMGASLAHLAKTENWTEDGSGWRND